MPSFEHTDSQSEKKTKDEIYSPGQENEHQENTQTDQADPDLIAVSKPQVTYSGDVEAEARLQEDAPEVAKAGVRHTPRFIDDNLPDPGPSILQGAGKTSQEPAQKPRRAGLKGRNRGGNTASNGKAVKPDALGEVNATAAEESLSGKRVRDGKVQPPAERQPSPRRTRSTENKEGAGSEETTPRRAPRARNDAAPHTRREGDSRRRRPDHASKPERTPARAKSPDKPARTPSRPTEEQPKTLVGKARKFLSNLFGGPETQQMTNAAPPAKKEYSENAGGNRRGNRRQQPRGQGGQRGDGKSRPSGEGSPNRQRSRRGGRGRRRPNSGDSSRRDASSS